MQKKSADGGFITMIVVIMLILFGAIVLAYLRVAGANR